MVTKPIRRRTKRPSGRDRCGLRGLRAPELQAEPEKPGWVYDEADRNRAGEQARALRVQDHQAPDLDEDEQGR